MPTRLLLALLCLLAVPATALAVPADPPRGTTAHAAAKRRATVDLVVAKLAGAPATLRANQAFTVSATVANRGRGTARRSAVRFYLSPDGRKGRGAIALNGVGATKTLKTHRRAGRTVRLTAPGTLAAGTYRLVACADDLRKVRERSDANNCRAAAGTIRVAGANAPARPGATGTAPSTASPAGPVAGPAVPSSAPSGGTGPAPAAGDAQSAGGS